MKRTANIVGRPLRIEHEKITFLFAMLRSIGARTLRLPYLVGGIATSQVVSTPSYVKTEFAN